MTDAFSWLASAGVGRLLLLMRPLLALLPRLAMARRERAQDQGARAARGDAGQGGGAGAQQQRKRVAARALRVALRQVVARASSRLLGRPPAAYGVSRKGNAPRRTSFSGVSDMSVVRQSRTSGMRHASHAPARLLRQY